MTRLFRYFTLIFATALLSAPLGAQTTAAYSLIYSYNTTTDGLDTYGNLVQAPDGNFWGVTSRLGANSGGVIFKITPSGTFTPVYNMATGNNGYFTEDALFLASDGNFYGVTYVGGAGSAGVIFKLTPAGVYTVLHAFLKATDGSGAFGSLVEGSDGSLYGTTSAGALGWGTIFKITKDGIFTVLHSFTGTNTDEASPYVGMIEGDDGNLYGVTNNDETGNTNYDNGSFFSITPSGTFTTLHEFLLNTEGGEPDAGIVEGPDGAFYGTTHLGGASSNGTFYKVTKTGTLTVLHTYTGKVGDPGEPEGVLALGSDGNFYGTGTVSSALYQMTPTGTLTVLKQMVTSATDGNDPLASPIFGADGNLYGPTDGGANGYGAIYKAVLTPAVAPPVQLTPSSSTVALGSSFTLNWQVTNAFSNTFRHCLATVQNASTGAGVWTGLQTGTVSGTLWQGQSSIAPTQSGTFTYALTCGGTETGFATITVPALSITAPTLTTATVGTAVNATFTSKNGLSPYSWTVLSGSLPPGLAVSNSTGAITGTPTLAGTYNFTLQVQDSETVPVVTTFPFTVAVTAATATVVATPSALTVTPGVAGTSVLAFSNFTSTAITVTCAGLPTGGACSTSAYSGNAGSGTMTLTVSTQGQISEVAQPHSNIAYALLLPGVLGLAFFRRRRLGALGAGLLGVVLLGMTLTLGGCSSSSPAKTTLYGTPNGTSTVMVTATAGSQTATSTITLTVQ